MSPLLDCQSSAKLARIAVVGSSCAGKTAFAQDLGNRLGIPAVDLDALHWGPNWTPRPTEEFHRDLQDAVAGERWIVSGNYRPTRPLFWPRLTTIIWLNYAFPTVFSRTLRRTVRRIITQESVCNGNRESIRLSFFSRESILWWVITTFHQRRQEYAQLLAEKNPTHVDWIEFRTPRAANEFLARLGTQGMRAC